MNSGRFSRRGFLRNAALAGAGVCSAASGSGSAENGMSFGLCVWAGVFVVAFLGATTFGDRKFLGGLLASVNLAGFPVQDKDSLKFCASNQVGDAVFLYAMTVGPIRDRIAKGRPQP